MQCRHTSARRLARPSQQQWTERLQPLRATQQQQQQQPAAAAKADPFAQKTVYNDGPLDKVFIKLFTQKMALQLGPGVSVPDDVAYEDFVAVSKEIMRGRSTQEQHALVRQVLLSLLPQQAPGVFRRLFPPSQLSAELNAAVASFGFAWLVGPSECRAEPVEVAPGQFRAQRSVVHIEKCRYLEASGCVGMCVNMCKVPTQDFFTNDFGLPLTMNPDFETLSCSMIFGQAPPPLSQDAAYSQPCFVPACSLAQRHEPCPKTDTERERRQGQAGAAAGAQEAAAAAAAASSSSSGGAVSGGAA